MFFFSLTTKSKTEDSCESTIADIRENKQAKIDDGISTQGN
jgi:hypothetical protein